MLTKAHHRSGNRTAGRLASLSAVTALCALSFVLALCAQASASARVTATLGAVAQATTQELSSTAGTTVGQVAAAPPTQSSPSAPDQPAPPDARAVSAKQAAPAAPRTAPAQPAAPASAAANAAASQPPVEARNTVVTGVVQETRGRIGAAGGGPSGSARTAVATIVHATAADGGATDGGGSSRSTPVSGVVQALTSSRSGDVVRTLSRTVANTTGSSPVAQTLLNDGSTLTATVAQRTRLLNAITQLTTSVAGPALATLQTIARVVVAQPPAASRALAAASSLGSASPLASLSALVASSARGAASRLAASSPLAVPSPPASAANDGAGRRLALPTALAHGGFGGWSAWTATPSVRARAALGEAALLAAILPRGQSAVSPPAQGAHRAPLPASPASTPSPGGVFPAAAVGVGAGLSIGLALASLLMLAAPLVSRRLRLVGESWRVAPLQLIADRPG